MALFVYSTKNNGSNFEPPQFSRGEICVANFLPPGNCASLGSYFCVRNLTSDRHCLNKPISPFFGANIVKSAYKHKPSRQWGRNF